VAVNLSPRQFRQRNLVQMVSRALAESGLPPSCLELEVTESVVMHSVDDAITTLGQLCDLGVQLFMDDFGRGYSSLYYLKRFPMHALKIDRSFVSDIVGNPGDASIVDTIISMSRSLNLKVVAEGVETQAQLDFLKRLRCDQMQGFLFSKPLPLDELEALFRRRSPERGESKPEGGHSKDAAKDPTD
jgi:EAL domain-containing protein (putative c-di-GMP-specific phosphodiesterase class I)